MRRMTALCAASAIALSAIATVGTAQAAPYHLIKWSGVEACQIWDNGVVPKPWPEGYTVVSKRIATFDGALAVKASLMKKGVCKI